MYVGAGEKLPTKSSGIGRSVLLYDDHAHEHGYQCLFTGGVGGVISMNELKEQLLKRRT